METITAVLPLSFITFLVVLLSLYVTSLWYKQRGTEAKAPLLPPGKTGLPIIGETLEFARCNMRGDPETFTLDRIGKFSDNIFRTSLMNQNVAVFTGASGNKFFFTTASKCISNLWIPKSVKSLIVSQENTALAKSKYYLESRKMTSEFVRPEFLQKTLVAVVDRFAKQHVEIYCSAQKQVRVLELAQSFTFYLTAYVLLSLEDSKKVKVLQQGTDDMLKGLGSLPLNLPGTAFHRAFKATQVFRKEIISIIKQRKIDVLSKNSDSKTFKDILSVSLTLQFGQDAQDFPPDTVIADLIVGIFIAATDTTSSSMTCIVKYLSELPHVYAQVLQEQMEIAKCKKPGESLNWDDIQKMKYTWCVAQEALRLSPPSQGGFREVDHDLNFDGFTIPKGWKAYWTVHSTNRNPEYFANPNDFDPTRFENGVLPPYTFVPFGGGSHLCPGREYAKLQILAFVHNLVTGYHFENILPDEKISYRLAPFPTSGLPVRISPRKVT